MKKITKFLDTIHLPNWMLIVLGVVFVFRIPSFFEPFSYGDEMIYLTLGNGIRNGLTLFRDIHDNKPPLLYLTAAIAGNVFWFRAILAFWSLVTISLFWHLTRVLLPKEKLTQKVATITFAVLSTIPLFEGQIANAENFMIGFTIAAFLILLSKKLNLMKIFVAGALLSIATLFKVPAAFDVGAIIFFWFIFSKITSKSLFRFTKRTFVLMLGFIIPIAATLIWYYLQGAFAEYFIAAFGQNFGYLSSFRPGDVAEPFLVKNGPLLFRGVLVLAGLGILFAFRSKLSKTYIFVVAWLLFGLFAVALSERPYPHYLLQIVPSISILIGFLVAKMTKEQALVVFPLLAAAAVPVYFRFWYYPSFPYYERFAQFATGNITQEEYFDKFDGNVNRNYEIAEYIANSTKSSDKIFAWGDAPPIYALSRRLPPIKYVATYHINDFSSQEETIAGLKTDLPVFIVVLPEGAPFPELDILLNSEYILVKSVQNAQVWRKVSPEISRALY